jgi:hypothetical protein
MNSNKDYEALHKFLLPNMKLEDVLVDMNQFKNEPAKPEKPKEFPPLNNETHKANPEDEKREVEKKSRKQKRLQERTQTKLIEKSKKETEKKKLSKEKMEERLKQIKESIKDEKKKEGLEETDVKRLTRVIFGQD